MSWHWAALLGLLLLLAGPLMAKEVDACAGYFRRLPKAGKLNVLERLHRDAWAKGGVCRHASAEVYFAAKRMGLPCVVLLFKTNHPGTLHVIPVLKYNGFWWFFESCNMGGHSNRWGSTSLKTAPSWYSRMGRVCTEFIQIETHDEIKQWAREKWRKR